MFYVLRLIVQYSNNRSVREFAYRPYEVRFGRVNLFIMFFTFLSSFRSISAITIISHQIISLPDNFISTVAILRVLTQTLNLESGVHAVCKVFKLGANMHR